MTVLFSLAGVESGRRRKYGGISGKNLSSVALIDDLKALVTLCRSLSHIAIECVCARYRAREPNGIFTAKRNILRS